MNQVTRGKLLILMGVLLGLATVAAIAFLFLATEGDESSESRQTNFQQATNLDYKIETVNLELPSDACINEAGAHKHVRFLYGEHYGAHPAVEYLTKDGDLVLLVWDEDFHYERARRFVLDTKLYC